MYWGPRVQDPLPQDIRQSAQLLELSRALVQIHFPDSWDELDKARRRIAFDEIFLLQLGVLRQKLAWNNREAHVFAVSDNWINEQIARFPFQLTKAQQHALNDLRKDMASGHPMNRLLQGDVGSGKTVVAALGTLIAAAHDGQVAIMAPTSVLAEQHYRNFLKILTENISPDESNIPPLESSEIHLMIGATPESEKREIRAGLSSGRIRVVIGTHALIEGPIIFNNLQLVIVDEQHRFGVQQRALLRSKGDNPHLLVMTATPIPRSLALTIYGDLDLTIIDEMPPGRKEVSTHLLTPIERERAYTLIGNQIQESHQTFIIYPLVEETEKSYSKAAVDEHSRLQNEVFPQFKIGLLHGRMKPIEKDRVMSQFRDGEFHILVSTSVIEVGVDIPNATVMLIEGANRFGLAQLHQLRGRVGRGPDKAYCILIPDTAESLENERLKVMTETNDGFLLAEKDLVQRGPGEFLGTRQSGYTGLKLANLADIRVIEKARRLAQGLFEKDAGLSQPSHKLLKNALNRTWQTGNGDIS
jgi:ATP-dependent DNA helicase RecG